MTCHTRRSERRAARAASFAVAAVCVAFAGTRAAAQAAATPSPAGRLGPYERALRLTEAGRGADGRALTDSLVAAAAPGSAALAEALWWRAALAASAESAERDLRRLLAEVPASPRIGPATVRLAQLALLRDRPEEATALLEPLARARAGDPVRPLAGYWLARARLERRDAAGACAALDGAAGGAYVDPVLAQQLGGLRQRVPGCDGRATVAAAPPVPAPSGPAAAPTTPPPASQPPGTPARSSAPSAVPALPGPAPASAPAVAVPRATSPAAASPPPVPAPTASAPAPAPAPRPTATAAPAFAVQVAAYDTRGGADALARRLRASGLDAQVEGQGPASNAAPFRVKVGRHGTRAAAAASLGALRRRGLSGFVTTIRPDAAAPAAP